MTNPAIRSHSHALRSRPQLKLERLESRIALAADFGQLDFLGHDQSSAMWFEEAPVGTLVHSQDLWGAPNDTMIEFVNFEPRWGSVEMMQVDQMMSDFEFGQPQWFGSYEDPASFYLVPEGEIEAVDLFFAQESYIDTWLMPDQDVSFTIHPFEIEFAFVENVVLQSPYLSEEFQAEIGSPYLADSFVFETEPLVTVAVEIPMQEFFLAEQITAPSLARVEAASAQNFLPTELARALDSSTTTEPAQNVAASFEPSRESISPNDSLNTIIPRDSALGSLSESFVVNSRATEDASLGMALSTFVDSIDVILSPAAQTSQDVKTADFEPTRIANSGLLPETSRSSVEDHAVLPPVLSSLSPAAPSQMTEGMRSLGMQLLHRVGDSIQTSESEQAGDNASSPRPSESQSGIFIGGDSLLVDAFEANSLRPGQALFVGEPIAALHEFENFNIFSSITVEASAPAIETLASTAPATLLLPEELSQQSRLALFAGAIVGVGCFVGRNYYNRDASSNRVGARIVFGHHASLDDEELNLTKPIVLKLGL